MTAIVRLRRGHDKRCVHRGETSLGGCARRPGSDNETSVESTAAERGREPTCKGDICTRPLWVPDGATRVQTRYRMNLTRPAQTQLPASPAATSAAPIPQEIYAARASCAECAGEVWHDSDRPARCRRCSGRFVAHPPPGAKPCQVAWWASAGPKPGPDTCGIATRELQHRPFREMSSLCRRRCCKQGLRLPSLLDRLLLACFGRKSRGKRRSCGSM